MEIGIFILLVWAVFTKLRICLTGYLLGDHLPSSPFQYLVDGKSYCTKVLKSKQKPEDSKTVTLKFRKTPTHRILYPVKLALKNKD